jgi:hypothetical protein
LLSPICAGAPSFAAPLSARRSGIRLIILRVDRMVFGLNIGTVEKIPLT